MVRLGRLAGHHARVRRPGELVDHTASGVGGRGLALVVDERAAAATVRRRGVDRGVHERVVDLEGRGARLHGEPAVVLLVHRQRRVGGGRGGDPLHDRQRLLGRVALAEQDLAVLVHDAAAGAGHQSVEPHREALVLRALHLDVGRQALLGELLGCCDHLVPGGRRGGREVLAVPEDLGIGVERRRPQRVLVGGGLQRALQGALLDLRGHVVGQPLDPARRGELGGPGDVDAQDVDLGVVRRRAGAPAAGADRRSTSGRSGRRRSTGRRPRPCTSPRPPRTGWPRRPGRRS